LKGISFSSYKKCFHYGFDSSQGFGWDEVSGSSWVWPETQGAVLNVPDGKGQMLLVVWDESSGFPYVISTKDSPYGSNMVRTYVDKKDPNVVGSGTDIAATIKLPEHSGENKHYSIEHSETNIHVRPSKASNRSASGYDTNGLLSGFAINADIFVDGAIVATDTISSIATNAENVFTRRAEGPTNQIQLSTNKSDFRLMGMESYYKVSDTAHRPSVGRTTEDGYQKEFAVPTVWVSRGSNLLLNRATGATLSGAGSGATGPDGRSNSALLISTQVALANAAQTAGTFIMWRKAGYSVSGITFTDYSSAVSTWVLSYMTGVIPATLILPVGSVFDVRIFSTVLTTSAIGHYYDDVSTNEGRCYLPVF
jgi:hypothetical protein